MDWASFGVAIFFTALLMPALVVVWATALIDLRYGRIFMFGTLFKGDVSREQRPRLFWIIEACNIIFAVGFAAKMLPFLMHLFAKAVL